MPIMTMNSDSQANERLDSFAREHGVDPLTFHEAIVRAFTHDIVDEIHAFVDAAERICDQLELVAPARGDAFGKTLIASYTVLLELEQYLDKVGRDPRSWPSAE